MGRVKASGGRTFSKTCLIRGREQEGRKAIIKQGEKETRVASIRADGLTDDDGALVESEDILDIRAAEDKGGIEGATQTGQVGERGTIVIPAPLRRQYQLV